MIEDAAGMDDLRKSLLGDMYLLIDGPNTRGASILGDRRDYFTRS